MLVTKARVSLVLGAVLAAQLSMPAAAMAQTRPYLEQKMKEQEQASQQVSLDPFDEETNALLAELGVVLQPVDPLWQNPDFVNFVLIVQEMQKADEAGDVATVMLLAFEAYDLGVKIPNEDVQKIFAMTPEEKESLEFLREMIYADVEAFKADPEGYLSEWFYTELEAEYAKQQEEYESYLEQHPVYAAYPYSEDWVTYPGRVAWLKVDAGGMEGLSAEWKQIGGTPVTWMNTASATDRAFLAPSVSEEGEWLQFEVTVTDGKESFTTVVNVGVMPSEPLPEPEAVFQDPIADLYEQVLGRSADPAGYEYWSNQYANGMSLQEIENHFRASPEYQAKNV